MRALDPGFAEHLQTGATTLCTCWALTRRDGARLGFTDHDRPLAFDGFDFEPQSGARRAAMAASADLSVDNTEIDGALRSDHLSREDLLAGRYDGARVAVWRVNWAKPEERVLLRVGVVGEVAREGEAFRAEIRGISHVLGEATGRVYQRQCDARLGDARCGVDLSVPAFKGAGTVAALESDGRFRVNGLDAFADGWFEHGALTWRTGANAGLSAPVKAHGRSAGAASITLWRPAEAPIAVGDAFDVTAGCDKRHATCLAKFANVVNFRGHPFMPGNDFAVSYPLRGEKNDGGRR